VSVQIEEPASGRRKARGRALFVLGHGAGGSLADPLLIAISRALVNRSHTVVRFTSPKVNQQATSGSGPGKISLP